MRVPSLRRAVARAPMSRIVVAFLLVALALTGAFPAEAARRVALILEAEDVRGPGRGGRDQSVSAMSDTLAARFGFDVLRFTGSRSKDPSRDVAEFKERLRGSEIALLYFTGPVEHDRDGTYLVTGSGAGEVNLNELLAHVVNNSAAGLALVEATSATATSGRRRAGPGRMPQIPDRLWIWLSSRESSASPGLAAAIGSHLGRSELLPSSILPAVREHLYLESAGLMLVRSFGTLPRESRVGLAPDRDDLLGQLRSRAKRLCEQPYGRSPDDTERKLVEWFAPAAGNLRVAALRELDAFSLDALLKALPESGRCPILPPEPHDEKAPSSEPANKPDGTAALTPPPAAQPEKPAATRPKDDAEGDKSKSRKAPPPQPEKSPSKSLARERLDDAPSPPKRREKESPPARSPPPAPSPSPRSPVNVPL